MKGNVGEHFEQLLKVQKSIWRFNHQPLTLNDNISLNIECNPSRNICLVWFPNIWFHKILYKKKLEKWGKGIGHYTRALRLIIHNKFYKIWRPVLSNKLNNNELYKNNVWRGTIKNGRGSTNKTDFGSGERGNYTYHSLTSCLFALLTIRRLLFIFDEGISRFDCILFDGWWDSLGSSTDNGFLSAWFWLLL